MHEKSVAAHVDTDGTQGFAALGIDPAIVDALMALGYEEPTPVQSEAIPPLLAGRDLVGQAATGTGKTAAFALPILQRLDGAQDDGPQALVLVPTRELAVQVAEAITRYGAGSGARVLPIYGGQMIGHQLKALRRGVDVVVATPGRALDHIRRGSLDLDGVRGVVLDEADEMLDMGFAEDIEAILEATPEERQTVLFSATLPARIEALVKRHTRNAVTIEVERDPADEGELPRVPQTAFIVPRAYKKAALGRVLDMEAPTSVVVFCRTRIEADELTAHLNARGYQAAALHGGLSQEQRDRVMRRFREQSIELLVATDVAARGLDIPHVSHVINYDVPAAPEAYVHRIGRTGRAGRAGVAITLAEPREHRLLSSIERLTGQAIDVSALPTVADLRSRQLQLTRAALEEALLEDAHDQFRVVVEALCERYDVMEVAAAAVGLAHETLNGGRREEEIPVAEPRPPRRSERSAGDGRRGGARRRTREAPAWQMERLYIGAGRKLGIRPADLVGAIAGEDGISSRFIGAIEIADRFSLVEVPEEMADSVIEALSSSTIRGRRVSVRRDRGSSRDA